MLLDTSFCCAVLLHEMVKKKKKKNTLVIRQRESSLLQSEHLDDTKINTHKKEIRLSTQRIHHI